MPKVVDHAERRATISAAALRLIGARGVDGVTMRELAAETGYSNGALNHYFTGRDAILRMAYEQVVDSTDNRIASAVTGRRGLDAVRAVCAEIMPRSPETRVEARIALSLWGRAMDDPDLAAANNAAVSRWTEQLRLHFLEAVADGDVPDTADLGTRVNALMTFINGTQIGALLDSAATSSASQESMLEVLLRFEGA